MSLKQGDFVYYDSAIVKISGYKTDMNYIKNRCIYFNGYNCACYDYWFVSFHAPYITWKQIEKACNSNIVELCNVLPSAKQLLTEAVHWLIQKERECSQNKS